MYRTDLDQEVICASRARHIVVTAPPGTGKTYLSIRAAVAYSADLPPGSQVIILTFSNQARAQLEQEARRQLSPAIAKLIAINNYHAFFWSAICAYRRVLGLPPNLCITSKAHRLQVFRNIDRELVKELERTTGLAESLAERAFPEFCDCNTPPVRELQLCLDAIRNEWDHGRIIFDDLGALFWKLLSLHPVLQRAYRRRYPIAIVDEHQDASALQDAVARMLGSSRLVVLADPMQLIHGFRGASAERLTEHLNGADERFALHTLHRWHKAEPTISTWLGSLRESLMGNAARHGPPSTLRLIKVVNRHGAGAIKNAVKLAIVRQFKAGCRSVAVLVPSNSHVASLQAYLCKQGLYPRRVGSGHFEESRTIIESLAAFRNTNDVARLALDTLQMLVPTLPDSAIAQAKRRVVGIQPNLRGASPEVVKLLSHLDAIFAHGTTGYVQAIASALRYFQSSGHHLPCSDLVLPVLRTADRVSPMDSLDAILVEYGLQVSTQVHRNSPVAHGLHVMTAHQSKGREFEGVVVTHVDKRFFTDTEDHRRLLYVALTRAKACWDVLYPDVGASPLLRLPCFVPEI